MVKAAFRPTIGMLKDIKLLRVFNETELGELITLGEGQAIEPHTNIIIEGELSWGLYIIIEGIVGIFKSNKLTADVYDVGQLRNGQYFGEMSLIDEAPRSATVRSQTECLVFHISKDAFQQYISRSMDLKLRFHESCITDLVRRLREVDESYVSSQFQLWKAAIGHRESA